jgi:hypothetical protein
MSLNYNLKVKRTEKLLNALHGRFDPVGKRANGHGVSRSFQRLVGLTFFVLKSQSLDARRIPRVYRGTPAASHRVAGGQRLVGTVLRLHVSVLFAHVAAILSSCTLNTPRLNRKGCGS